MNKRILSLTLALVMVLGSLTVLFAEDAETALTPEQEAGKVLKDAGILVGDDEGDLNLDEKLERRDTVVLLSRLLGEEKEAKAHETTEESPSWTDVRTDNYYLPFLAWAETEGYYEGKEDNTFGPRENINAGDYSLVLLRALNHDNVKGDEAWKNALNTAKNEGLLANVEVERDTEITRGQMAIMTVNALGKKVKGSDETLGEKLGIELPEAEDLKVKEVYADNLKEVIVELTKEVDAGQAENIAAYTLNKKWL